MDASNSQAKRFGRKLFPTSRSSWDNGLKNFVYLTKGFSPLKKIGLMFFSICAQASDACGVRKCCFVESLRELYVIGSYNGIAKDMCFLTLLI